MHVLFAGDVQSRTANASGPDPYQDTALQHAETLQAAEQGCYTGKPFCPDLLRMRCNGAPAEVFPSLWP